MASSDASLEPTGLVLGSTLGMPGLLSARARTEFDFVELGEV